jgi:hypothetical protein
MPQGSCAMQGSSPPLNLCRSAFLRSCWQGAAVFAFRFFDRQDTASFERAFAATASAAAAAARAAEAEAAARVGAARGAADAPRGASAGPLGGGGDGPAAPPAGGPGGGSAGSGGGGPGFGQAGGPGSCDEEIKAAIQVATLPRAPLPPAGRVVRGPPHWMAPARTFTLWSRRPTSQPAAVLLLPCSAANVPPAAPSGPPLVPRTLSGSQPAAFSRAGALFPACLPRAGVPRGRLLWCLRGARGGAVGRGGGAAAAAGAARGRRRGGGGRVRRRSGRLACSGRVRRRGGERPRGQRGLPRPPAHAATTRLAQEQPAPGSVSSWAGLAAMAGVCRDVVKGGQEGAAAQWRRAGRGCVRLASGRVLVCEHGHAVAAARLARPSRELSAAARAARCRSRAPAARRRGRARRRRPIPRVCRELGRQRVPQVWRKVRCRARLERRAPVEVERAAVCGNKLLRGAASVWGAARRCRPAAQEGAAAAAAGSGARAASSDTTRGPRAMGRRMAGWRTIDTVHRRGSPRASPAPCSLHNCARTARAPLQQRRRAGLVQHPRAPGRRRRGRRQRALRRRARGRLEQPPLLVRRQGPGNAAGGRGDARRQPPCVQPGAVLLAILPPVPCAAEVRAARRRLCATARRQQPVAVGSHTSRTLKGVVAVVRHLQLV